MAKVTIEDIAKKVGVTKGLVSRALTGKYNVSEAMRDEITRTAVSMGYDFTRLRAKSQRRRIVVLILSSQMLISEEYWQPIMRAISSTLDIENVNMEYFIYDEIKSADESIARLKSINASGYIFIGNNPEEYLTYTESTNRPVVVIDPKTILSGRHLQIKFSNFSTSYNLTKMLISKGHRNIAFYGPSGGSLSFFEREDGFLVCVKEYKNAGVTGFSAVFDNQNGDYADNKLFEKLLTDNPEITAVVCANDIIAYNAIKTMKKLGKTVPDDYSVVGFDNIRESRESIMNLTTANVPRQELGVEAAKYVVDHINSKQIRYFQIVIDCEIIMRGSVKDINNTGDDL